MTLTRDQILKLFNELNEKLKKSETKGELYIVGGAAMCLAFQSRPSTQDIDGVFKPASLIRSMAVAIADEHDLPTHWLNDAVKGYLSDVGEFTDFLELDHLRVYTPTTEYILAMKCLSMRLGIEFKDEEDVRFLLKYCGVNSVAQATKILVKFYPLDRYPQKTFYALEEWLTKNP